MTALSPRVAANCANTAGHILGAKRVDGAFPSNHSFGRGVGNERPAPPIPGINPYTGWAGFNGRHAFVIKGRSNVTFTHPFGAAMPGEGNRSNDMLITFRGSSMILQDYIGVDLAMAPSMSSKGFMVHGGFNTIFKSCRADIDGAINSLWFDNPHMHTIHICGHSMGGALATLCAEYLIDKGFNIYLYTFGAPRVGVLNHANYMWSKLGTNIRRYYYGNDFITWLPVLPYWHLPGIRLTSPRGEGFMSAMSHGDYFKYNGLNIEHQATSVSNWISTDMKQEVKNLFAANPPRYRSATAFRILLKALGLILRTVGGLTLFIGVTILDQIVHMLTFMFNTNRKGNTSVVLSVVKYAVGILGMPFVSTGKCIRTFLTYVFNRLFSTVSTETQFALAHAARAERPVVRFD
jgi:pimeloyl-ACP methyl ester carboxylesterase